MVGTLSCGLDSDSRCKRYLNGQKIKTEQILLAKIADDLAWLAWSQTKDGQHNKNKPKSILSSLLGEEKKEEYETFETFEEFQKKWNSI